MASHRQQGSSSSGSASGALSPAFTGSTRNKSWEQFILPERQRFQPFGSSSPQLSAALGFAGGNSTMSSSGSPFLASPHGHPSFNPTKLGSRASSSGGESRTPKPVKPAPPDKPLMPYMRYSRKVWDQVKSQNPDLKLTEVGKMIGRMWRDLPEEKKEEFVEEYEAEKMEYNDILKSYHSSPAYQSWISSKPKVQRTTEERRALDRNPSNLAGFQSPQKQTDGKISIQATDEEEDPDEFSVKHMAAARYLRNHRLVNEIFGDSVVPDVRSVVTTTRMQVLKRQVQSLTMHQKKLEAELQQIEEKFDAKKRKFLEASEAFQEEMKKRCSTKPVDAPTFQKMVDKALDQLKREQALREEQANRRKEEEEKQHAAEGIPTQESREVVEKMEVDVSLPVPPSASEPAPPSVSDPLAIPVAEAAAVAPVVPLPVLAVEEEEAKDQKSGGETSPDSVDETPETGKDKLPVDERSGSRSPHENGNEPPPPAETLEAPLVPEAAEVAEEPQNQ